MSIKHAPFQFAVGGQRIPRTESQVSPPCTRTFRGHGMPPRKTALAMHASHWRRQLRDCSAFASPLAPATSSGCRTHVCMVPRILRLCLACIDNNNSMAPVVVNALVRSAKASSLPQWEAAWSPSLQTTLSPTRSRGGLRMPCHLPRPD